MPPQSRTIVQHGDEVRLWVNNEWYAFNLREAPLGSGAMGTVYVGWACARPGVKVAIKRVADRYADVPSIRERARLEGGLLFRHKNLVEMIGVCEYAPNYGPMFIISYLVRGINLDKHVAANLRSRKDAVKKICECMFPVLDALDYLHSKGIVHLDIKPSNIMIENGFNIRLMDLGIASVGNRSDKQAAGLVGTPQYAAPEQYSKEGSATINATTDIYEAGVTLYELLTNSNPFDAPTIEQTMCLHRTLSIPYVKSVPKAVVKVLRKATAPMQKERYQTALEFKKALMAALEEKSFFGRLFG